MPLRRSERLRSGGPSGPGRASYQRRTRTPLGVSGDVRGRGPRLRGRRSASVLRRSPARASLQAPFWAARALAQRRLGGAAGRMDASSEVSRRRAAKPKTPGRTGARGFLRSTRRTRRCLRASLNTARKPMESTAARRRRDEAGSLRRAGGFTKTKRVRRGPDGRRQGEALRSNAQLEATGTALEARRRSEATRRPSSGGGGGDSRRRERPRYCGAPAGASFGR